REAVSWLQSLNFNAAQCRWNCAGGRLLTALQALLQSADNSFRQKQNYQHDERAVNQQVALAEFIIKKLRRGEQKHGADDWSQQRACPAQHGDDGHLYRDVNRENAIWDDELEGAAIKSACKRRKKGADQERTQLVIGCVNAHGAGCVFIFPDGHEVIAKA